MTLMEQEKNTESHAEKSAANPWEKFADDVKDMEIRYPRSAEKLKDLDWLKRTYADGLDYYVDSLYENGRDSSARSVDDYTYSLALEKIAPEEKQLDMIRKNIAGESVADDAVLRGLSHFLQNCSISPEDIVSSPFARKAHAEYLAGRADKDDDSGFLWDLDKDFGNSTEAMSLISDHDYLKNIYGKDIDATETENIVSTAVLSGEIPLPELLSDPFLRQRRIEALKNEEDDKKTPDDYPEEIVDIWDLDKDFSRSLDYDNHKRSKVYNAIKDHPEIYTDVNQAEVERIVGEAIEKFSNRDLRAVLKLYQKSPYEADQVLLNKLVAELGLSDNPPKLVYEDNPNQHPAGGYNHKKNQIYFYHVPPEKTPTLTDRIKRVINPQITPRDEILKHIDIISHETWHAYQHNGVDIEEERKNAYALNFKSYDTGEYCFGGTSHEDAHSRYKGQLVESEAWAFGKGMQRRAEELC